MQLPAPNEHGKIDAPAGVYVGVPEAVYRAINAANQSAIKRGITPAHFREALTNPEAWHETKDKRFGRLAHMALLEPDRYAAEVSPNAPINQRTGEPYGFETKAWREEEEHWGQLLCTKEDHRRIAEMVSIVRDHPTAAKLLSHKRSTEVVAVWDCPASGVRCKLRMDFRAEGVAICDYKTAESAAPAEFERSVSSYGYDIQGAFYPDGFRVLTGAEDPFCFIVQEKEPPFAVAVYELDSHAVRRGRAKYRRVLREYAACLRTGEFPAYTTEAVMLGLPRWDHDGATEEFEIAQVDHDPFASVDDGAEMDFSLEKRS